MKKAPRKQYERPPHSLVRKAWYGFALFSLLILLISIPGYSSEMALGVFQETHTLDTGWLTRALLWLTAAAAGLSGFSSISLAALIFFNAGTGRMGLFLAYYLILHGLLLAGPIEALYWIWPQARWINSFLLTPVFQGPATLALILLFPSGTFVPGWSRWLLLTSIILAPVYFWGSSGSLSANAFQDQGGFLAISSIVWLGGYLAAIYTQVYRWRHVSTIQQKQQTKWVIYGIGIWLLLSAGSSASWVAASSLEPGAVLGWWFPLSALVWTAATLILPVLLTVAITRYRLFDIDRLINRTLVYGLLTALLVLMYFVNVVLLENLFRTLTGSDSPLVVVTSTLVLAGVFQPLRRRLQAVIDSRFYRRKVDAARLLEQFALASRDEVSLERLVAALLDTAGQSMQPEHISIRLVNAGQRIGPPGKL